MLGWFLLIVLAVLVVLYLLAGLRLLYQYERGVVFTLGRYGGTRDPGMIWVAPVLQNMRRVDMRIKTADIPRQEVITRDNIPILAATVVYFKVVTPEDAIIKIEDYSYAVRQYTQAALRDVVGNSELDFAERARASCRQHSPNRRYRDFGLGCRHRGHQDSGDRTSGRDEASYGQAGRGRA
jgi:regulator of protease activity HflC (stomatin/prohibitin superfamily)